MCNFHKIFELKYIRLDFVQIENIIYFTIFSEYKEFFYFLIDKKNYYCIKNALES